MNRVGIKHLWLAALLATFCVSCSEKAGSPVGTWDGPQTTVTFGADGSVVRHNWSLPYHPDYLAPLEEGKPGTWKTKNHNLFLTATKSDGTTTTQRYKYSVRAGSNGEPAFTIEIEIAEGPNKSSYIFTKR